VGYPSSIGLRAATPATEASIVNLEFQTDDRGPSFFSHSSSEGFDAVYQTPTRPHGKESIPRVKRGPLLCRCPKKNDISPAGPIFTPAKDCQEPGSRPCDNGRPPQPRESWSDVESNLHVIAKRKGRHYFSAFLAREIGTFNSARIGPVLADRSHCWGLAGVAAKVSKPYLCLSVQAWILIPHFFGKASMRVRPKSKAGGKKQSTSVE
jgi:hypothetical protein